MRRREFVSGLGSAAIAWPIVARAQQTAMPVIGFLRTASIDRAGPLIAAFRKGLGETDYVEGKNVAIVFRSAEDDNNRLPAVISELIRLPVAVLVCNVAAAVVAKTLTMTVPIVFATGTDPVEQGLVPSLSRPGGNLTGVSFLGHSVGPKQLELLRQLVPTAKRIAVLEDTASNTALAVKEVKGAARVLGIEVVQLKIGNERELESASAALSQQRVDALLSVGGAFFLSERDQIVALAARQKIPAIYHLVEYVEAGGLMSYGASITDAYHKVGVYAGKILKGAKPADLPVEQSRRVELVLNLKTAKALGITFPQSLLIQADEVIE